MDTVSAVTYGSGVQPKRGYRAAAHPKSKITTTKNRFFKQGDIKSFVQFTLHQEIIHLNHMVTIRLEF
jgi:hypothetical protein